MDIAFIIHLHLDDVSTLADVAQDISDDLTNSGHDVLSVEPWARPTATNVSPFLPLIPITPPPTQL